MIFRLPIGTVMTPIMVEKFIEKNCVEEARRAKLYRYYLGQHDILNRTFSDPSKVNNKIVSPFCHYVTTMYCGYLLGKPVQYKSENDELIALYDEIQNYNDDAAENMEIAKDASICGCAYEMCYLDPQKNIRYKRLDPRYCIPVYDNTAEENLLYFIRYYDDEDIVTGHKVTYVEVYDNANVTLYKKDIGLMQVVNTYPHNFGMVPIAIYQNNTDLQGDFETVLSLIDAYDKTVSDTVNDGEYFADAYLAIYGALGTETEDLAKMKENRVLLMDTDCRAEWLTKTVDATQEKNVQTTLESNIYQFSGCPNLTDENFAGDSSGVAIKYKLLGFENATSKKETGFRKGLQMRLELICNMLAVLGTSYNYRDIEIVFTRNLPENINDMADLLQKVGYLLSKETQLSLLPLDIDVEAEKERLAQEKADEFDEWNGGDMNELLGRQNAAERTENN